MRLQKFRYLVRSIVNFYQSRECPNCSGKKLTPIDSKYFFTRLFKCSDCKLNFRFPVDSEEFIEEFYQSEYQAGYSVFTQGITSLPSKNDLQLMMESNFYGKRDYSPFVKALSNSQSPKILDYGCSWGYSVYQLRKAGYDAEGFELSKARADFGKNLQVTIYNNAADVKDTYDVFMSSHAIEHVRVVSDLINFSKEKLTPDGTFIAFCPNGSPEFRARDPHSFHVNWGLLHPNYLDVEFSAHAFRKNPYLILTDDWQYDLGMLKEWDGRSQVIGSKLDGQELLIIAKPNIVVT